MHNNVGCSYHSGIGCRESQEDRCCLIADAAALGERLESGSLSRGSSISMAKEQLDSLHKISLVCLFDGHSGSTCSDYMSENFAKMLIAHDKFLDKSPEAALLEVCRKIDGQVI
jgi:serine/threonine protein phosphatase PrpC